MSDAHPLPARPNLGQYKKLAKDLQAACKSTDSGAVLQWAAQWLEAMARRDGAVMRRSAGDAAKVEQRWNKLKEATDELTRCTLTRCQFFIAREHGFKSWPKFANHIQQLERTHSRVSAFEAAVDAIVNGDTGRLGRLLAEHRGLARDRSTREHRSTLLHYVSANGVEGFRQKTPKNIVEITHLLLDAGADIDAESDAYGGGCTTLGLVATSVHPERAGVQIELMQKLIDRGATFHQPSAGGNNHSIVKACLANGQPVAAKFLAEAGAPLDLEGAAALGRTSVLEQYFDEYGAPRPEVNPKQITSAFLYACGYGSPNAVEFLLSHGVDLASANDDGQTGLHWATYTPQIEVIRLLLARGAPVTVKDQQYGATPLDMALWTWTHAYDSRKRESCYEAVALLARAGAKLDPDQWRNTGEASSAMLKKIDSDDRMKAALNGEIQA